MQTFFWISLGAVIGANCRYWLGNWAARQFGTAFPYGTLLINLTGSLVIGLLMEVAVERFAVEPRLRALLVVGFLGSYTTFSSYAYEGVALILNGRYALGGLYLLGSSLLGGLAVLGGIALGRMLPG
ncbi:MAG: fluoride efflux transporter CrcB [Chloroflexota bacterium]